jgi:hypothetical protein
MDAIRCSRVYGSDDETELAPVKALNDTGERRCLSLMPSPDLL